MFNDFSFVLMHYQASIAPSVRVCLAVVLDTTVARTCLFYDKPIQQSSGAAVQVLLQDDSACSVEVD